MALQIQRLALIGLCWAFLACANAQDAPSLQNSVERFDPGRTSRDLSDEQNVQPPLPPTNVINIKTKKQASQDDSTVNIRFRLKRIVLIGNKIFTTSELEKLYADKINTNVSLNDLQEIAQKITEYYRNAGYVISQAILPQQEIGDTGIVKIQIIEGYVDKVSIIGCTKENVCELLKKYGMHIAGDAPLKLAILERYSFLANDIPGVSVRAILSKSPQYMGAADLSFIVEEKNCGASLAYNNY